MQPYHATPCFGPLVFYDVRHSEEACPNASYQNEEEAKVLFAEQGETAASIFAGRTVAAAWHDKPSFYAVAKQDRIASVRVLLGVSQAGSGARVQPTNTGLTEWEWDPESGRWALHSFNELSHLLPLARS